MSNAIIVSPSAELVKASGTPALLDKIRPHWQAKSLIDRVRRLLEVDPSSACQRLLNAAIHDLREKVTIAGVDIAAEAAKQHKLPPVSKAEDIENYSTANLIDLAYRMGLLTRPEWRRVCRCYEIRRDLEHEDDEYEAGVEDCVYIFTTCIEVILAVDPVDVIRVTDVKALVEQTSSVIPDQILIEDYKRAPQPRQEEILKFLISVASDKEQPDIVQQNAYGFISYLRPHTQAPALASIGAHLQNKVGRGGLDIRYARVARAAGVFPYLRQSARKSFYEWWVKEFNRVGVRWTAHEHHGDLLRNFIEVGALAECPDDVRPKLVKWLVLTYIGEPGGHTSYGNVRHVFYSNSAAPLIKSIFKDSPEAIKKEIEALSHDKHVKAEIANAHVARRYESLLDIFSGEE